MTSDAALLSHSFTFPTHDDKKQQVLKHVLDRDYLDRKKSAAMLFAGSVFGLLGFALAYLIGFSQFRFESKEFASGHGYFPSTVSEMVSNPREAAGKCFSACELIASIFIFVSQYPTKLANVYTGDDHTVWPFGVSIPMFRQFLPAAGMMIVATVPTTPFSHASMLDYFSISVHGVGAFMLFGGYIWLEGWAICGEPKFRRDIITWGAQLKFRRFLLVGILFFFLSFIIAQVIISLAGMGVLPICCNDEWAPIAGSDDHHLVDTASGNFLGLKSLSYAFEVLAGIFLVLSHASIWYFSVERNYDCSEFLLTDIKLP